MKIFKDWENEIPAFLMFLGKDVIVQKRRMRKLHEQYYKNNDLTAYKQYNVQLGAAMQMSCLYNIAKYHFKLDNFNRKHIINNNENRENIQENSDRI